MKKFVQFVFVSLVSVWLSGCVSTATHNRVVQELTNCQDGLQQCRDDQATERRRHAALLVEEQLLRQRLEALVELQNVEITVLNGRLSIRVLETVLFNSGSAEILPQGRSLLTALLPSLQDPAHAILVEGHTDNKAIGPRLQEKYSSNWALSCSRASSVVHYLQAQGGVVPTRLAAMCHGSNQPVAANATAEGRRNNRRVVIDLVSPTLLKR